VALLVETSTSYGRNVLSGIALYVRENGPWSVNLEQRSIREGVPAWLAQWRGDGIISRLPLREIADFSRRTGIPVVDLNEQIGDLGLPLIFNDQQAIGRMAAEHLLERGFTQFGYIGQRGGFWSDGRRDGFAAAVAEAGYACDEFLGKGRTIEDYQRRVWETETPEVAKWVARLPKPTGVMACNAFRACQLAEACRLTGAAVPEQLAVIAGDDEDVACRMAIPPLSAVVNSAHQIGYEAASLLDTLMQGKPAMEPRLFIPPERVVTRQSTDITALQDPLVAAALQFIRQHACHGINVDDVLRAVLVSRSKLQDRFRRVLGRTIHDIIVGFRVERAKELLTETSLPLPDIADRTGFKYVQYLSDVFQQRVGIRPGKYRAQHTP
jgi:LacI family transcriptional regulator